MENIERVYFINLDHRADRLQEFVNEMKKIGFPEEKLHRISATYRPEIGVLGCAYSHIQVLDHFLQSSAKNCLVFEDDFQWSNDLNYCKFLFKTVFQKQFDLVMLSGNIFKDEPTDSPFLRKVLDGQTTSSYLITREFAPSLKKNLEEGAEQLESWFRLFQEKKHDYCLDIYWKKIQPMHNWYIVNPKMGIQRESYSDIEKKVTNYGV